MSTAFFSLGILIHFHLYQRHCAILKTSIHPLKRRICCERYSYVHEIANLCTWRVIHQARSICILNRAACCLKLGQSRAVRKQISDTFNEGAYYFCSRPSPIVKLCWIFFLAHAKLFFEELKLISLYEILITPCVTFDRYQRFHRAILPWRIRWLRC